jgi:hypothetical protein
LKESENAKEFDEKKEVYCGRQVKPEMTFDQGQMAAEIEATSFPDCF